MNGAVADLNKRAVETLYVETMLLADDARSVIEHAPAHRHALDPLQRTCMAVEQLRVTTRLMHVIAWLLTRRAVIAGEIDEAAARSEARRLGSMPESDLAIVDTLPDDVRLMIHASMDLARRAAALERALVTDHPAGQGPANDLLDTLRRRLAA